MPREKIQRETVLKLYRRCFIDGIKIEDIAMGAGISRQWLYELFKINGLPPPNQAKGALMLIEELIK